MKKLTIIFFPLVFILGLITAGVLVTQQFIELDRANNRVLFAKLLENEDISDKLSKTIYLGLKADSCIFKEDRKSGFLYFFLGNEMDHIVSSTNQLLNTTYFRQAEILGVHCK